MLATIWPIFLEEHAHLVSFQYAIQVWCL